MIRGQERMHVGLSHETAVADRLRSFGWHVEPFGQGLFTDVIRSSMQHHDPPVLLRWLPDLIASRAGRIVLVEAKSRTSDTPNNSLEIDCLSALTTCEACWSIPVVIVWGDFTVNRPRDLRPFRWVTQRESWVSGSRTPFVLVRKSDQLPFERFFGRALRKSA